MSPHQGKHDGFDDVELEREDTTVDDYGRDEGAQSKQQKRRGSIPPNPADFGEIFSIAEDEDEYDFIDDTKIPKDPHYDPAIYVPPPPWEQRYHTTRLLIHDTAALAQTLPNRITALRQTVAELDAQQAAHLAVRAARTSITVGAVLVAGGVQVGATLIERTGPIVRDRVGAVRAKLVGAWQEGRARADTRASGEAHQVVARRRMSSPAASPYAMVSERVDELPTSVGYVGSRAGDGWAGGTRAMERGEQSRFLNKEADEEGERAEEELVCEFDEEEELEYDRAVRTRGVQWVER